MSEWINYKELRRRLEFRKLLDLYRVGIHERGEQASAFCPLPGHGERSKSRSFSVNLARGVFRCFGCGAKGGCLDFVVLMDGGDPARSRDVRDTALKLAQLFGWADLVQAKPAGDGKTRSTDGAVATPDRQTQGRGRSRSPRGLSTSPVDPEQFRLAINAPLDFELKSIDPGHRYLAERGFTAQTIATFGVGFCSRGMLRDRIAIPLHDPAANLVGYAGKLVDDRLTGEDNPRYRFPGKRIHDGVVHEFRRSLLLYNAHRVRAPVEDLVLVMGFADVWWLWQHGVRACAALMGWSCSAEQAKLVVDLVEPTGRVWLLPNGNDEGVRCAETVLRQVAAYRFVRWLRLTEGQQPIDLTPEDLLALLPWADAFKEESGSPDEPPADAPVKKHSEKPVEQTAAAAI